MYKLALASLLAVSSVLASACNAGERTGAAPSAFSVVETPSFAITPSMLAAQPAFDRLCPPSGAFAIPLTLLVRNGELNVTITDIALQFVDTFGVQMPQVTLPAPVLTAQFGSMLVEARKDRTVPLVVPIGCGMGRSGTVTVIVSTRDHRGRAGTSHVRARVF